MSKDCPSISVLKKNNAVVPFDGDKIKSAIRKSAERVNITMTTEQEDFVVSYVENMCPVNEPVQVKTLHNYVECALDSVNTEVARSYREYRNYKTQFVKMLDQVYRKKLELNSVRDASNANADSELVTTQKAIAYAELNGELYKRFFLTDEENKAQEDGYIYIHDKGARLDTSNCFRRDTRFITNLGVKSFYDFNEGDTVTVLSHKGVWRNARVVKLPWSKLQRVWIKRGNGNETYVDCTPNHRWILKDGSVTTELKVGDALYYTVDRTRLKFDDLSFEDMKLWCLGFGFADGSVSGGLSTEADKLRTTMRIRLCGRKVEFADRFCKAGYKVKEISGTKDLMVYLNEVHNKRLPYNMDEHKIAVFMNGYMCADGCRQLSNGINSMFRGVQVTGEFNDWMYDFLNIAGYYVTRTKVLDGEETNYGVRRDRTILYGTFSSSGDKTWRVTRIEDTILNPKACVWCLDVEEDHSFMLEKGIPTGNCMLCDVKAIFKGGFRMGNVQYREPKTVGTAISLMVDIILNAGACQYGGFTVSEIDKLLAPYAKNSYDRYYAEYEDILGRKDQMGATLYATKKLNKELEDGAIECEMRLNSATTARGDFVFSSLSFGLSDDRFGQMVSSAFLKVRRTGAGTADHIPVLFPKLTFMYDENKHGAGKEQEWLFLEAVECTKRAQYPDFLSMTGDGYAPSIYKKYGVTISRMGCVDGNSQVIYRDVYGDIHECYIEEMWEHLSKCFPVLSQESLGYSSGVYIDLHGVRIFDKDGFVNCSRIIKNTQNPRWYRVTLTDGKKLVCTADHPWTTWFSNVSHVTQTKDLVPGDVVEVFFGLPSYTEQNDVVKESVSVQFVEISSIEIVDKVDVSYDVTTESEHFFCSGVRSHNCRANLSPWYERGGIEPADEDDRPVYEGRWNMGAISLNFPMIVRKSQVEHTDFWDELTYYLDLCRKIHIRTLEYFSHKKAGINPLIFCEGGGYGGHLKETEDIGRDTLKPCTVSFGIAALNEATMMYKGKSLYEDKAQFAEEILRFINDYATKYKKEDGILYAVYGTPAESLCSLQVEQFRKKYGIIKGVSDRKYMSNSFHVHVSEDITPIEKMDTEYKCFHLCNGGNIIYNRFGSDYNTEAYVTLIREAMKRGYYYGCNISKNYCCTCGAEFLDEDKCPSCGSDDLVRISRVCGYLGLERVHGDTRMNEGKRAEIDDRKCM